MQPLWREFDERCGHPHPDERATFARENPEPKGRSGFYDRIEARIKSLEAPVRKD